MNNAEIITLLIIVFITVLVIYKTRKSTIEAHTDDGLMYFNPKGGHKIYELNLVTLDMTELEDSDMTTEGEKKVVVIKDNHLYCTALNEKNAIKRFNKMVPGEFKKV